MEKIKFTRANITILKGEYGEQRGMPPNVAFLKRTIPHTITTSTNGYKERHRNTFSIGLGEHCYIHSLICVSQCSVLPEIMASSSSALTRLLCFLTDLAEAIGASLLQLIVGYMSIDMLIKGVYAYLTIFKT
ncbi:hypothetical protein YC2023_085137 [Brassica napus]